MTTYFQYQPNTTSPFSFQPTLDGQPYNATVTWALWGQRPYLNLYSLSDAVNPVVSKAIVGSTNIISSPLTTQAGLYTASVASVAGLQANWTANSVNVPAETTLSVVTASGIVRLSQPALMTGTDPDASFSFDIDLIWGYGFSSTLVFRAASQQFEVSP